MVVSVAWSLTRGGSAISTTQNLGTVQNGSESSALDLWLEHDGLEALTGCGFYVHAFSGSYTGGATAEDDYDELLVWGAAGDGFQINQNTEAGAETYVAFEAGVGTVDTPITLSVNSLYPSGGGTAGTMAVDAQHHVQVKIAIPTIEAVAGKRQWDTWFAFTYTS